MVPFPIADDKNQEFTILLGMLDPAENEQGIPVTACVMFIFGPDKKLKLSSSIQLPLSGRSFDEILKVVISFKLTMEKRVDILVNWRNEDSVTVLPTIPEKVTKKIGIIWQERPLLYSSALRSSEKLVLELLAQHREPEDASC